MQTSGITVGARQTPRLRWSDARPGGDPLQRAFAFVCLVSLLILNVALPGLQVGGFPIRGIIASGLLVFLAMLFLDPVVAAARRNALLLVVAGGLALLGTFVSIVNAAPLAAIVETVTEVHLQAAVTLLVATVLARLCGAKACVLALVGVVGASGLVAVVQVLGIEAGWTLREGLGDIQGQALHTFQPFLARRPMGMSYSPIQLATQLCLAFGAYAAVRELGRRRPGEPAKADPAVMVALGVFLGVCVATGTRSPILGGLIFFAFYTLSRRGSWVAVFLIILAGILYLAWPSLLAMFEAAQPRIVRVDDSSAQGHLTLAYYGLLLFIDNPLGYGFAFKPFDYWTDYWHELYKMPSPGGAQSKELHDYLLNMMTTYGIGLLLFVPVMFTLLRRAGTSLIFFVPYTVQIMFHNAGPFWNDTLIWFAIAAVSAAGPAALPVAAHAAGRALASRRRYQPRTIADDPTAPQSA